MRLIDTDKLLQKTWEVETKDMFHMTEIVDVVSRKDIDNAPTVKAISIEWINSYTTGLIFSDDYEDNADSIDYYIDCIKEMVRDWEKENETN